MIEIELKINSKTLWMKLKHDPKYWLICAFYIAFAAFLVYVTYKSNYFAVVTYHIKHGSLATQFKESAFWWYTFDLVLTLLPLISFFLTLPPVRAYRFRKRYPDYKSTLVFDEEKIINDFSYKGINNHTDAPYDKITKVTHKNGLFNIRLKKSIFVYDDCFINGTPAELEALLKEKCANKCKF